MKKILSKCTAFLFVFSTIPLISCHDVIFDTVRDEVKLEEAQVSGDINSIVRFTKEDGKEYLFVDNGNIWYKDVTDAANGTPTTSGTFSGGWVPAFKTGIAATHIIKLAADSSHLYALGTKVEANSDSGDMEPTAKILYASTDGDNWTAVTIGDSEILAVYYTADLFCTNSIKQANRHAFINVAGTVYKLEAGTATAMETGTDDRTTTPMTTSHSCVYFEGNVYFSASVAFTTNETKDADATIMYVNATGYVYYKTADSDWTTPVATNSIYAIAYTADYLILGTSDGVTFVTHENGIPTATTVDTIANASSTLSSYYEVYNILSVDPTKETLSGDLYGTTTFSGSTSSTGATIDNVGLWAYYPGRGNWNRE